VKKEGREAALSNIEALEARLADMERRLDRLRSLYESFFSGIERMPPNTPRRELNRLMVETQQIPISNASMRFRFQSLLGKWVQHTNYWNRTMREIEAGTYRRDLAKVQKRLAASGAALTESDVVALGIPAKRAKALVEHQQKARARLEAGRDAPEAPHAGQGDGGPRAPGAAVASSSPSRAAPPEAAAAAPASPSPLSEQMMQAFYDKYVEAHRALGAAPEISREKMQARLSQEIPRIMAQRNCTSLELDIEVKEGRVRLKARPIRP
jgi:hypothetical protein